MDGSDIDQEWSILAQLLPTGWREAARTEGALLRAREIDSPDTLLRLILLHAAAGLSLRQTVARAEVAGLAKVSDVALFKRLRASEPWLRQLCRGLLEDVRCKLMLPDATQQLRVRAIDASTIKEPGATGTSWRLHYSIALPSLECDFFEVTDVKGGESFKRFPAKKGDVILADRGYCHRPGAADIISRGADLIVRLNHQNFPLFDERGRKLSILSLLRRLKGHNPGEWPVAFEFGDTRYPGRLCAVRKSIVATQQAQERILKEARKKQKEVSPHTLECAGYIFVFTTLKAAIASCENILEMYRARWQIELAFKRMKSLFGAGHVPKYDPESARAWIQAKLLAVLMIERLEQEAALFSPWGFPLPAAKRMA
jgi:hypothetical protein